jgi:hypothetical protein
MTQENFDNIVEMFKKRYILSNNNPDDSYKEAEEQIELLKIGIVIENYKSPWSWMLDLIKINKDIILYFDGINEDWCKKYHEDRINFSKEPTIFPDIYKDFNLYVDNLMSENYIECIKIKEKIFNSY